MKIEVEKTEPAAMVAMARAPPHQSDWAGLEYQSGQTLIGKTSKDRPSSKCPHYGMTWHSKGRCFELIRYPENWDKSRDPHCNKSWASIADTKNVSDHIVEKTSAMIVVACNDGKPLNIWIIDLGATEQMTCDSR